MILDDLPSNKNASQHCRSSGSSSSDIAITFSLLQSNTNEKTAYPLRLIRNAEKRLVFTSNINPPM